MLLPLDIGPKILNGCFKRVSGADGTSIGNFLLMLLLLLVEVREIPGVAQKKMILTCLILGK